MIGLAQQGVGVRGQPLLPHFDLPNSIESSLKTPIIGFTRRVIAPTLQGLFFDAYKRRTARDGFTFSSRACEYYGLIGLIGQTQFVIER
jgi:hypothetical protein